MTKCRKCIKKTKDGRTFVIIPEPIVWKNISELIKHITETKQWNKLKIEKIN